MMSASDMEQTPVQNLQGQFTRLQRRIPAVPRPLDAVYTQPLARHRGPSRCLHAPHRPLPGLVHRYVYAASPFTEQQLSSDCAVCYALAIYLLNLLLAFLQPKFDPSLQEDLLADDAEEGTGAGDTSPLPSARDDEFRPFVRRLPEWQFWLSATRATLIGLFCTVSEVFDVPVYWPILVVYFFVLFALTMRRQIQHMIKYKYVPFDIGRKARYGGK
ncbi:retrieval of early ER protein Rer1 [Mycena metata]|uniref:Retrieval of early ER protein Rer1 n=1 Tax=Mycena metata TaxID=1033252 RepID=A0AAD7KDT0_9AGAR|nr:retrieval of early ER protein Rer1 [Mycena metata]